MDVVGGVLMLLGAAFVLLAGVGVLRFEQFRERVHPATKSSTLGIVLIAAGAAMRLATWRTFWPLVLTALLILLTAPVGGHLLGRASYASGELREGGGVDELARDAEQPPEP